MVDLWNDLSRPPLRERGLRLALTSGEAPAWRSLDVVARTGSTNADLADRARAGEEAGAVLTADHQVAGKGRLGREWSSPPRAGLATSVLLRPTARPDRWSWLTLLAGVAIVDAIRRTTALEAVLKWPNDLLVPSSDASSASSAKLGGLLAEVVPTPQGNAVVLGFGINVSQSADELPVETATSLRLAGSATIDRDPVLRACLRELARRYREWEAAGGDPAAGLGDDYRERCSTIGSAVRVHLPDSGLLEGTAEGVDDEGRLLVRPARPGGEGEPSVRALSAGDVVHIRPGKPA